jgi:4-amino-4-deoxy-L-arabinose transferase-like glycosyltransferase
MTAAAAEPTPPAPGATGGLPASASSAGKDARRPWAGHALLLVALSGLLAFVGLGSWPLMDPDEPRSAMISRLMVDRGDWLAPHLPAMFARDYPNDPIEGDLLAYWDKPPLYFWLTAAAMKALGPTELAARLVAALSFMATVLMVYAAGRSLWGPRAGLWAGLIMAVAPMPLALAHVARLDGLLVAFMTLMLLATLRLMHGTARPWRWTLVLYAAAGLGFLTKGPEAIAFPVAAAFITICLTRRWSDLRPLHTLAGIALFLAIAAPWFIYMGYRYPASDDYSNPGYLTAFFYDQHFGRAGGGAGQHLPPGSLVGVLLGGLLPWTVFLPGAVLRLARDGWRRRRDEPAFLLLATYALLIVGLFSCLKTGQLHYALPAFPPLAVLVGAYVARSTFARLRTAAIIMTVVMAVGGLVFLVADPVSLSANRSTRAETLTIRARWQEGDAVLAYPAPPYSFAWYLMEPGRPAGPTPGGSFAAVSDLNTLVDRLNEPHRTFCLLRRRPMIDSLRPRVRGTILVLSDSYALIATDPAAPRAPHDP